MSLQHVVALEAGQQDDGVDHTFASLIVHLCQFWFKLINELYPSDVGDSSETVSDAVDIGQTAASQQSECMCFDERMEAD